MPRRTPLQIIDMPGFVGGLNRESDSFLLEHTEVPDALNVTFGLRGSVKKRTGFTVFSTTHANNPYTAFRVWDKTGGSTYYIAVDETDGSIWSSAASATMVDSTVGVGAGAAQRDYPIATCSLNNVFYLTSLRATGPYSFDGSTWTLETATTFDGTSNRFPVARHLLTAHDRVFAFNLSDGGTLHRSRVAWSNALDAETWDAADFIDFDPDDGYEVQAVALFGEAIVVFKDHSVQLLTGKGPSSFARYAVDHRIGTVSPETVKVTGGELFFFDRDTGVWSFDGAGFDKKDDKINSYLLSGMNYSLAYKATGFFRQGKYYLSVPWGSDTHNSRTFVYDTRIRSWTEWDMGWFDADADGAIDYGVGVNDLNGIHRLFNSNNDKDAAGADVAIDAYIYTPWIRPEGESAKTRLRRLDTVWDALGNFTVNATMYRNFNNNATYIAQTINTDAGGFIWGTDQWGGEEWGAATDDIMSRTTGWGQRWRSMQFKFGVDQVDDQMQLNSLRFIVSTMDRVRGEP